MKRNDTVSVVISTKKRDEEYVSHVRKFFSHPKTQIIIYENNGEMSLAQAYNKGLNDAENDIVVFMHDDLILETKSLTSKIIKLFEKNPEFGIIGVAGTDNLTCGTWWNNREDMYGVVGHINEGKRHVNKYSQRAYNEILKPVVIIDGLFMVVHKKRLKKGFNEEFKGFHFYDLPLCVENYLEGVKIGVTTKIGITHKSIGMTNKNWERNKLFFEALYEKHFPLTA
jgi:hypothetical protein